MIESKKLTASTLKHYEEKAQEFWEATKNHDVTQNYNSFLMSMNSRKSLRILDFGCGPGRDLKFFKESGHLAFGLDGSKIFCDMAVKNSGCMVFHQDFIDLDLKEEFFDGIFANASLFHVPKEELPQVLRKLRDSLKENGVLFSSNPKGNREEKSNTRYANYMNLEEYKEIIQMQGFELIKHYYRPSGVPLEERPWLACVLRKKT